MSRSGESVTRLDIRFPNEMYDRLQKIAIDDGAKIHHISRKAEISPTVLKLIQFALDHLEQMLSDTNDNLPSSLPDTITNTLSDNLPDTLLNTLSDKIDKLSDKAVKAVIDERLKELGLLITCQTKDNLLNDKVPDNLSDRADNVPDSVPDNLDNISDRVDNVPDIFIPLDASTNFDLARPPQKNIEIAIVKFTKYPDLRDRVANGIKQGLKGSALGNWLFDGGFLNAKNKRYDPATVSHFRAAIEWIEKVN